MEGGVRPDYKTIQTRGLRNQNAGDRELITDRANRPGMGTAIANVMCVCVFVLSLCSVCAFGLPHHIFDVVSSTSCKHAVETTIDMHVSALRVC